MKQIAKTRISMFVIYGLMAAVSAAATYDPTWTKSQCGTYSYNGLKERYVYGSNRGWVNNDKWDATTTEGVDCASYVCRALALPGYVAEGTAAPYPYTTTKLIAGVANMTQVASVNDLQQWDVWVYVTSTSKHTGLFKEYSGSYIITREARSTTSGVVEGKFSKQSLIDRGTRYWRRSNWASTSQSQIPTVQTAAATSVSYSSAKLNGAITNDGSELITSAGFAWGTTSACSSGWIAAVPASDNTLSVTLTGLNASTTYYFRAQAQNRIGWGSGSVLSFKTPVAPVSSTYVIDNGQTGTSSVGTWAVSGGEDPYGAVSLYARAASLSYTWTFTSPQSGTYDVYMWWTEYTSRGTAIPVAVTDSLKTTKLVVNQQANGGRWNRLGTYTINAGQSCRVKIATIGDNSTAAADAVCFVRTN